MKRKFLPVLFAGVLACCGVLTACKDDETDNKGQEIKPIATIAETAPHYYNGGLHRINVTQSGKNLIENGKTDYQVVYHTSAQPVLTPLTQYLYEASGVTLAMKTDDEVSWDASKKWIVVGSEKLFTQAGLTMPTEDLGSTGYYIVTKGNSIFIIAKGNYGIQNGIYTFLEYTIGYDAFSEDTVVYNKSAVVPFLNFDITEKPDYEFILPSNIISIDGAHRMRMNAASDILIPTDGTYYHNSLKYLPPDKWMKDNDKWYNDENGDGIAEELCYTAHGDTEAYEKMMAAFMERLIYYINQKGSEDATTITITTGDHYSMCECKACMDVYDVYGTHAAAVIHYVNDVSVRLDEYLVKKAQEEGTKKREINLLFFAYHDTTNAPIKREKTTNEEGKIVFGDTITDENGNYIPVDDSVKCRDNVAVYLAPIKAYFNHSFYDEKNTMYADLVKQWSTLSSKLYMWLYNTNFDHYFYAYNSFDASVETYRYCKNYNAIFMNAQGQWNQTNPTGFTTLKEYLNSKALWNVNYSTADIYDRFFKGYFGEAAVPMRQYFDEMQSHLKYLDEVYAMELPGGIYDVVNNSAFYSKVLFEKWLSYVDEAYEAIEPLKTTDPEKYALYAKHIKQESLYPRFALIELYSGYYTTKQLDEMKASFLADTAELKVSYYEELVSLDSWVSSNW